MDRSYLHEHSPSHQHWEDKHEWAESVVRWGTTCEPSVTICPFCPFVRLPGTPGARGGHGRVGGGSGAGQGAWKAGGVAASQPSSGTAATAGAAGLCFGRWAPGEARGARGRAGEQGHTCMMTAAHALPAHGHPPASSQLELLGQRVLSQERGRRVPQAHSINNVKWPRPWHHHAGAGAAGRGREGMLPSP